MERAIRTWNELRNLFFQNNWHSVVTWPKLKCTGAGAPAETNANYIIWAK